MIVVRHECWFCFSYRSWSSPTSSLCFTAFTLSSPPKLLVWTRCSWKVKARRPPLAFPPCPPSHVTHRRLKSNTPLDRRLFWHAQASRGIKRLTGKNGTEEATRARGGIKIPLWWVLHLVSTTFLQLLEHFLDLKYKPLIWEKTQKNFESKCILLILIWDSHILMRHQFFFPPNCSLFFYSILFSSGLERWTTELQGYSAY